MKLEELKKICDEATPGPWEFKEGQPDSAVVSLTLDRWGYTNTVCCDTQYYPTAVCVSDMRFIAAARTMLPKLIAVAEAVKAARDFDEPDPTGERLLLRMNRIGEAFNALEAE